MKDKQIKEMARLMDNCNDYKTCNQCIAASRAVGITENCDLIEYATKLYKAGYRKQQDAVKEFADRVLKDITDAINHNARIMESSRNLNQASYHNALTTNNTCKGIYDVITAIAKEHGAEVE